MSHRKSIEPEKKLYFLFHKPQDTVCSTVSDSHKTVFDFFPKEFFVSPEGAKLHTVGRLDSDTEGFLILTNDGKFSNYLTRPESGIKKTYFVRLKNKYNKDLYQKASKEGVTLPPEKKAQEQKSSPFELNFEAGSNEYELEITVTEGKFHEVKRIFRSKEMNEDLEENEVVYLKRVGFGSLRLEDSLEKGKWREMTGEEISRLLENKN